MVESFLLAFLFNLIPSERGTGLLVSNTQQPNMSTPKPKTKATIKAKHKDRNDRITNLLQAAIPLLIEVIRIIKGIKRKPSKSKKKKTLPPIIKK
jgi:hypothetical protein